MMKIWLMIIASHIWDELCSNRLCSSLSFLTFLVHNSEENSKSFKIFELQEMLKVHQTKLLKWTIRNEYLASIVWRPKVLLITKIWFECSRVRSFNTKTCSRSALFDVFSHEQLARFVWWVMLDNRHRMHSPKQNDNSTNEQCKKRFAVLCSYRFCTFNR